MKDDVYRLTALFFLMFGLVGATAHGQFSGGGGYYGGPNPGAGFGGGAWRTGGGIAGGGWHGGGAAGAGYPSGMGYAPGMGASGASAFMPGNPTYSGGTPGYTAVRTVGVPGQGVGFNSGMPGAATSWSNAHPYPWCNGCWHNHAYGNGFNGYGGGNYPLGWGLGGWGQGNQWYNSGYVPYSNPYYASGVPGPYGYGQPIPIPNVAQVADAGNPDVELAIDKFRAGDYAQAQSIIDGVIRDQPSDAAAHELRGLVLFAMKNYSAAAATIHSVLATGPGWDWTTLSSVYSNMQLYKQQLTALERYVAQHPDEPDARFLLAYHYMTAAHNGAAKDELEHVVALAPSDKLAAKLLQMIVSGGAMLPAAPFASAPSTASAAPPAGEPASASATAPASAPAPASTTAPDPDAKPVDPAALLGDWHAKRDDGAAFELHLASDGTFAWKMTKKDQNRNVAGNYTLDKAILTLKGPNPSAMVAQVTFDGGNRFTFKPIGGPANDPGLTFVK